MLGLRVTITRYLNRAAQPPWVEAELVDANGKTWRFEDKEPIFCDGEVTPPAAGVVRCFVLSGLWPAPPDELIVVTTLRPDHVEATENAQSAFLVRASQLFILTASPPVEASTPCVVRWTRFGEGLPEAPLPDLGGFFGRRMRWKDYIAELEPEGIPYAEAIRAAVLANNIRRGGDWHQADGVPVFDDGAAAEFSYRSWGDLLAAIWSEQENQDYEYLDFYMDYHVKAEPHREAPADAPRPPRGIRFPITIPTVPTAVPELLCAHCGLATLVEYAPPRGRAPYYVCRSCGKSSSAEK